MTGRDPLRFTAPHPRGCDCPPCQRVRDTFPVDVSGKIVPVPAPRTPEDGKRIATPEDGKGGFTRDRRS